MRVDVSFLLVVVLSVVVEGAASASPFVTTPSALTNNSPAVGLAWNPSPTPEVTGYSLYYGLASAQYSGMLEVGAVTNVFIGGLDANATYYFTIAAHDDLGNESPFCNEVAYTTPGIAVPPTISAIPDQAIDVNTVLGPVPFTAGDPDTPADQLVFSATSSNPAIVPNSGIALSGAGTNRTVTVTPAYGQTGTATIIITVSDGSFTAQSSFNLYVRPLPSVILTAPVAGSTFTAPAVVTLAASVVPNGHTVTKVQFLNGSTLVAECLAAPFTASWTGVSSGTYSISARLFYDATRTLNSATAGIVVSAPPPTVAMSSPTDGMVVSSPSTVSLAASVNANGHSIQKVRFLANSTLVAESAAVPYQAAWTNPPAGDHVLAAQLVYDASSVVNSAPLTLTVATLPAPWQTKDIGTPAAAGSASVANSLYTVAGAGTLSGRADAFRFVYQPLGNNGEIRAQIRSTTDTGKNAVIGAMIRESLTENSSYALAGLASSTEFRSQVRSATGGNTTSIKSGTATPPDCWARLVRSGNTISSYRSTDGLQWTLVKSFPVSMAANVYAGLAVSSGTRALNTSTFSNVVVVAGAP